MSPVKATTSTTWWWCLLCDESGVYEQAGSGGKAEAHTKATDHGTTTSLRGPKPEGWSANWPHPRG